ncbi:MAG TPA: alkaline phosphatase PhoX [Acidimicrobiales bacterium]
MTTDRRTFVRRALYSAGAAACLPDLAMVTPAAAARERRQVPDGPYGSIEGRTPDASGLLLPEGFTARVVAVAGEPVGDTDYRWHVFPDGAATFDDGEGGWYYVCNSEVFTPDGQGGASAIHFGPDGEILDAYRVLGDTTANCAGGPTPWGTWLSCEEKADGLGQVWECDPTGERPAEVRPALGRWRHEAVAVDPDGRALYLTEDDPGGKLYRFTPDAYPDLSSGVLEAMVVADDGSVTWVEVPDPQAETMPTQQQVPEATTFPGAEGIWYHDGTIVFTNKGDNQVHALDIAEQRHRLLWDGSSDTPLGGVDNVTVATASGDVFVAEDGGNLEIVVITPEGDVVPFLRVTDPGHEVSELTGPVFSPDGTRLYFSSQRGPTPKVISDIAAEQGLTIDSPAALGGITWEVTGPFRNATPGEIPSPATTLEGAGSAEDSGAGGDDRPGEGAGDRDDGGGSGPALAAGAVVVAAAAAATGLWWRRRRTAVDPGPDAGAGDGPDDD